jgi:hypothetical protein
MPRYVASIVIKGPLMYRDVPGSLCVIESPDGLIPSGRADCTTHDEHGVAVWVLRIGKEEIPGRWVLVGGEFRLVRVS